ncbi:UDP-forming cellulose synthase catalytic subunit [Litoribrevibacter albus]|uniref:Cellulose synthase catalytic subunit [UDP-forming] n=1 Tax=Litoribrevibacter albus TaxID=1473156 RepID=A0AA37S6H7_9GAMM|nr:UDP-forming cellulose synthase catalytic subunit [Litoribrevibacter albus]GLQ29812.1 cellulose synthase catalytic subunit (UDP-forming) [Litoribrevibacter albus]
MQSAPISNPVDRLSSGMLKIGFAVCGLFILYMSQLRIALDQQFILGWGLVALLFVIRMTNLTEKQFGRVFLVLIASFISIRYFVWRVQDTLIYIDPLEFFLVAILFLAEVDVFLVHFVGMFTNIWPLNRKDQLVDLPDNELPTVDIFIPTYTEPAEVVKITATACTQINYPKDKLNIHILDDGGTEQRCDHPSLGAVSRHRARQLKKVAGDLGISYITRPKNEHAKAGNINHAMKTTYGELILILDCDHVPTNDILRRTVGWFIKDPKLYLVQTPHFFINPDPVEKTLGCFHSAPSEGEMFYRGNQPANDFWNSAFFCGSAGVLRRTFLDEVGGISGDTITEDAETSIKLHAKGYNSVYVSRPMVCGLSAETFSDFIIQRSRWCQGMLQIGLLKNPMLNKGLKFYQKLCYSSSYLYWFFGFARFIFFVAPTLFLSTGIQLYHASLEQVTAYALPHLFASFLMMSMLFGKYRWPLFSELYETVQSIFLLPATLGVIQNPRAPSFIVTPKGATLTKDFLSPLAPPFYIMILIMLSSLPAAIFKWHDNPQLHDGIIICTSWLMINLCIAYVSLGIFWEKHQVRNYHRAWASGPIRVQVGDVTWSGSLTDFSLTGLGFHLPAQSGITKGQTIMARVKNSQGEDFLLPFKVVRATPKGDEIIVGGEFKDPEAHYQELVHLVYGDSQRWMDFWNRDTKPPSLLKVFVDFLRLGMKGARQTTRGMFVYFRNKAYLFLKHLWITALRRQHEIK